MRKSDGLKEKFLNKEVPEMEENRAEALRNELFMKNEHASKKITAEETAAADNFCEGYKDFLDAAKTEREAVKVTIELAKANGFIEFKADRKYAAGEKVYLNNRGKSVILAVIGSRDLEDGVKIAAAHIDSPRLDLKPNPLYEEADTALFKTHYYGGIKKYQWTAIPLSLHGVVIKKNGETVEINVGEDENDPCFVISDLLPHLASNQMKSTMSEGIKGEGLNVLVGSRPFDNTDAAQNVKLNVLSILFEKYGIMEEDFLSAELEIVPAFKARDIGFDRSLIGAYGHDDRVCAYPALMAALDTDTPEYTVLSVLTDKEETGSDGNTGLNSSYLKFFIYALADCQGAKGYKVLSNSKCLSADVNAAYDTNFPEVFEKNNTAFVNRGVVITKYTGARGKSGTSDASAEFMAEIRELLDRKNVCWQTGELGKVDEGGGGTVAKYVASLNMDVVDIGVAVISMHAPYETVSKIDVYMTYRACYEFFND